MKNILKWTPYVHNSNINKPVGQISCIKDSDNNIIVHYLLLESAEDIYSLVISGNVIHNDFKTLEKGTEYANKHFQKFISQFK